MIKKRIWSRKSDPECGHASRKPLLEFISKIMKVFNRNSEWNKRYAVGKISQSYTNLRLTSIARYGLQKLQNRLRINRRKSWRWLKIYTVRTGENKEFWEFELLYAKFECSETWKTQKKGYRSKGLNVYSNLSNTRNFCVGVRTPQSSNAKAKF